MIRSPAERNPHGHQSPDRLVDDTDGSDAAETVQFSPDGQTFEIDLSVDNAAKLRDALTPSIERGRKAAKDEGKVCIGIGLA